MSGSAMILASSPMIVTAVVDPDSWGAFLDSSAHSLNGYPWKSRLGIQSVEGWTLQDVALRT